jgi:hypothetical protein
VIRAAATPRRGGLGQHRTKWLKLRKRDLRNPPARRFWQEFPKVSQSAGHPLSPQILHDGEAVPKVTELTSDYSFHDTPVIEFSQFSDCAISRNE